MPKIAKELSAIEVKRIIQEGLYSVGGVAGLHLQVTKTGARSWILRAKIGDKRRDIGLGAYPETSLAMAREKALEKKSLIANGIDPVEDKRASMARLIASQRNTITFDDAADKVHAAKSKTFKNDKYKAQWISAIRMYASPFIGKMPVAEIDLASIKQVFDPIWDDKTDTAKKLRGNVEAILAWATVNGYRKGDNPARWQGYLDQIYNKPSQIKTVKHHAAMKIDDMPSFMPKLREQEGIGARALEFTILTAARSGEVRGASWDEIDLDNKVWTIPAERMKGKKEHRSALSNDAIALLQAMPRFVDNNLVFPSPRGGKLSDMTLSAVLKRMDIKVVPHGFRSTFRDWASERTNHSHEVKEMALAHTVGSKVEAAYRRGDLFEKRIALMQDWADFINNGDNKAKVIDIKSKRV
ncbi:MAG: integrase arm-type DNA-binding domain-containing protein [Methylotenera sp.]